MSAQHGFYLTSNPQASGSSFNTKRKRSSWCIEDYSFEQNKQMRIRSPPLDRRQTYPTPDLIADSSAPTSDDDTMDVEMPDQPEGGEEHDMEVNGGGFEYENGAVDQRRIRTEEGRNQGYAFGAGGSGGFGFGPGTMEDEEDEEAMSAGKATYPYQIYPSLTPHPNPHHFSNLSHPSSLRPKSPLSAQTYSTSLRAPSSPHISSTTTRGLLQPTISQPLAHNATDVERARAVHGPQCKSIPRLTLSQYPDPVTGERSMWSQCGDCGAIERSM